MKSAAGGDDINQTFEVLASNSLIHAYTNELVQGFKKNRLQEAQLKAPKAEGDGAAGDKKKKKQAATSLQFGSGTRKFFDYLLLILGE